MMLKGVLVFADGTTKTTDHAGGEWVLNPNEYRVFRFADVARRYPRNQEKPVGAEQVGVYVEMHPKDCEWAQHWPVPQPSATTRTSGTEEK